MKPAGGFTLLEVLVSLALLGLALVIIFQLFSAGLKGVASSDDYAAAVIKAESVMREILDDDSLAAKSWSEATTDGYSINAAVTKAAEDRTENLQVELLEISVTVHWRKDSRERAISIKTMKVVNKQV